MTSVTIRDQILRDFDRLAPEQQRRAADLVHGLALPLPVSRFTSNVSDLDDWAGVVEAFSELPERKMRRDDEVGDFQEEGWIYRGHHRSYPLAPSIERQFADNWPEIEYRLFREFQSQAPIHMDPTRLPAAKASRLDWLSILRHYDAPTRLLDFTYSPYVALYFALRHGAERDGGPVEVWGIDAEAVRRRSVQVIELANRSHCCPR